MHMFKKTWAGAALLTLCITLTARSMMHGRLLDSTIYMVSTFFTLALAFAAVNDN